MQLSETSRPRYSAATALHAACSVVAPTLGAPVTADVGDETLPSLSAPRSVETRIGTLEFSKGVPSRETAKTVFETIDFTRALNVYNNSFRGASALALQNGFQSIGAKDNDIIIFSKLMDARSLFLTANADTV